jgi:phosphatidylglycerophosphate synthase
MKKMNLENRRDVATRKVPLFQKLARGLVKIGLRPNQISIASAVFATLGGIALGRSATTSLHYRTLLLIGAICAIQFRLVCNLIDGLMAVEGGLKTASGELFNDVPDRISDAAILIGAGFAAQPLCNGFIYLGWTAALLAVLTAYIRTLGASLTGKHDFSGPMAKQHRMFLITLGCLASIFEDFSFWPTGYAIGIALGLVALGSLVTCANRLLRLYRALEEK